MDDPNEENVESNWVLINTIDIAEEATTLNFNKDLEHKEVDYNQDNLESEIESDGISIISENSQLHESSNEENIHAEYEDDAVQEQNVNDPISTESALQPKTEPNINWTFVDSKSYNEKMASLNQFYLNCLQEPVQELSEHELGTIQSDLESDSISIISDSESLNDFIEDEKKLVQQISVKENCDEFASKLPTGIKKYCSGVLIGTILLATTSIFLGHYFNSVEQIEEELPIYTEEYKNEIQENVAEKMNEKYEVPTALTYCQERHKADDNFMELGVNKCLKHIKNRMQRKEKNILKKEEIEKLEKYLKIKEQYLKEKEQILIRREYELLKVEQKLKQENLKKFKNKKHLGKPNNKGRNDFKKEIEQKESKVNINVKHNKNDINDKIRYHNFKKYHFKSLYKSKKDKSFNTLKKEHLYNTCKHKKGKNSNHNINKNEKNKKIYKNKKDMKIHANENDFVIENYKNRKVIENLPVIDNGYNNKHDKFKATKTRSPTNYIILENNDNQTISGYWVGKLYKGRSDLRNKKHGGDWYFDRASYRKTKRDKAKWYFDWMMDREILRYKRSYYI